MTKRQRAFCNVLLLLSAPVWGGFFIIGIYVKNTFFGDEYDRDHAMDVWTGEKWFLT